MSMEVEQKARDPNARTKRVLPQVPATKPVRPPGSRRSVTETRDVSQASLLEAGSHLCNTLPAVAGGRREFVSPVKFQSLSEGEDSSVTVAVRVRPFSKRELRLDAKQVVRMHRNETIITSKDGLVHRFYYDHCFWSFDEIQAEFADQEMVYRNLAQPLVDRSFEGYNTCLFAYGQTGSGKSYCIMGEGEDLGIVPQFSKELYDRIEGTTDEMTSFKVQVSYYEIYNERIYDLLASTTLKTKTKLRVREHPVMGPYVEDLSTYVATSYKDIEHWLNLGNRFRATAATGMNDRSSRSHSVFTIMLTQTSVLELEEHSKVSRINLIDLAGSERSAIAQTTGERLREGANINRSLHTLGKVISLLSEKSTGKRKKVYIPYRDSTLTWLLKESLGGNSKTAMIATISPADLHHNESLSTLRYAQQARTIINVARINEDPNARIIRDLRQEIEFLRTLLGPGVDSSATKIRELREKLKESEKLMTEATCSWQEKLVLTEARRTEELEQLKREGMFKVDNRLPNLVNLNDDPQLSEMLLYVLREGVTSVGSRSPSSHHDIQLTGALVANDHCSINNQDGVVTLEPSDDTDAQTFVNGALISEPTVLHHGDRVVLGGEHFFRFNHPLEVEQGATSQGQGSFEFARNELIKAQTARLEAELEEKRLREREEMMRELQAMKEAAQQEMDQQREDYTRKLTELEGQMQEQSLEVSVHQRTKEETDKKLEELLKRNQALEEETLTQKHLIHLEKIKTEKEYAESKEQKSRLMMELEQERNKLEGDIIKLNTNKQLRERTTHRESTTSLLSVEPGMLRGSELVRLAMMLQEATAICKNLSKPLTFSREETFENGEPEVRVRVNNTQLGVVTYWDLPKFEFRLEQMRDVYQGGQTESMVSLDTESSSTSEEGDPFHDPSDIWVKDSLLTTPHSSPHRAAQLRRSILAGSASGSPAFYSPASQSVKKESAFPRSLAEVLSASFGSRGASPALATADTDLTRQGSYHQLTQSLPRVCYDHISKILSFKEDSSSQPSVYQRILSHVWEMNASSQALEDAFDKHAPTPDLNVPFSETTEVRLHTVSLYSSLELLLEAARALQEQCKMFESFMNGQRFPGTGRSMVEQSCGQFIGTIHLQTALYCSKLLQGIDRGVEETLKESRESLRETLDSVISLTGQLALARRVQDRILSKSLHPTEECGVSTVSDDFFSVHPYQKLAVAFYQGHCEWCVTATESTSHSIQDHLRTINQAASSASQPESFVSELVKSVCRVMSTSLLFLQRLAEMQAAIWNLEYSSHEEGTLPLTPNTHHVVEMLVHLQQVQRTMASMNKQTALILEGNTNLEKLSLCNNHTALCCNELAASVLTVITKSSVCPNQQKLSFEVQTLSRDIARAGKSLNHLIKKASCKQASLVAADKRHPGTSMAAGELTHSSSPPPPDFIDTSEDLDLV